MAILGVGCNRCAPMECSGPGIEEGRVGPSAEGRGVRLCVCWLEVSEADVEAFCLLALLDPCFLISVNPPGCFQLRLIVAGYNFTQGL